MSEEMEHNHKTVVKSSTSTKNNPKVSHTVNEVRVNSVKNSIGNCTKLATSTNDSKFLLSRKQG